MKLAQIIEKFRVIVRAPNGIQYIRDGIHQLALTGRLSRQDSSETVEAYLHTLSSEKDAISNSRANRLRLEVGWSGVRIPHLGHGHLSTS